MNKIESHRSADDGPAHRPDLSGETLDHRTLGENPFPNAARLDATEKVEGIETDALPPTEKDPRERGPEARRRAALSEAEEENAMNESEWEQINLFTGKETVQSTDRMSVPGGWIYKTIIGTPRGLVSVATTFVPFARFSGDAMLDRFATSPQEPEKAENRLKSAIPDFSAPAPKRGGGL